MKTVDILDKRFELSISSEEILAAVQKVADKMNTNLIGKDPVFLCVLNGAFMFGADLLKRITIPCEISFVKLSSYHGTESTGEVNTLIGLNEHLKGKTVVILEDIVDSGITIKKLHKELINLEAGEIHISSMLLKPDAYHGELPIEYVGLEIPNDFVVGYGLDYDGYGRNLEDIYKFHSNL